LLDTLWFFEILAAGKRFFFADVDGGGEIGMDDES